jgi:Spy/CpxP family protein refolding chaperone
MSRTDLKPAIAIAVAAFVAGCAAGGSPYTAEKDRDIKALSAEETASLLAGKGMGFAKAAELNGYPGPSHVLELAAQLGLTEAQRARTQALFDWMQAKAKRLGSELVEAERDLDRLFASKRANDASLAAALARIGELQGKVRGAHLEAHLAQASILTAEQSARYESLRGYASHAH